MLSLVGLISNSVRPVQASGSSFSRTSFLQLSQGFQLSVVGHKFYEVVLDIRQELPLVQRDFVVVDNAIVPTSSAPR